MKPAIHPEMHVVKVHCGCGNEFETLSTTTEIRLELCNACHPFYTGKKRSIDAAGRVQKYEEKYKNRATVGAKAGTEQKKKKA